MKLKFVWHRIYFSAEARNSQNPKKLVMIYNCNLNVPEPEVRAFLPDERALSNKYIMGKRYAWSSIKLL